VPVVLGPVTIQRASVSVPNALGGAHAGTVIYAVYQGNHLADGFRVAVGSPAQPYPIVTPPMRLRDIR
jgi:hypothetical protein